MQFSLRQLILAMLLCGPATAWLLWVANAVVTQRQPPRAFLAATTIVIGIGVWAYRALGKAFEVKGPASCPTTVAERGWWLLLVVVVFIVLATMRQVFG